MLVFITSLDTNEPLSGVQVSLVSFNNQVIAAQKSDKDGVAHFSNYRATAKDFQLKLVTAELDNDFNFINLSDYRVETSRYEVEGKYDGQKVYDAFIYGDRNIYRPGEKVYCSAIVRNLTNDIPAVLPVRVKVYNPRGTMVNEQQHTLNEQGSFEMSYQSQAAGLTGELHRKQHLVGKLRSEC